jgi:hypothetical protein
VSESDQASSAQTPVRAAAIMFFGLSLFSGQAGSGPDEGDTEADVLMAEVPAFLEPDYSTLSGQLEEVNPMEGVIELAVRNP